MGVIIPTWDQYTGGPSLVKAQIMAPYQQTTKNADETYEFGGFPGGKVDQITADQITTGTLTAVATLGDEDSGFIKIDGPSIQMLVHDGTTNRIVIEP